MRCRMVNKLALLFLLILAGCSSVRGPVQPEARFDADNNFNFALRLEAGKQYAPARESYQYAYGIYQSFAGVSGQLACLSGLARLDLAEGDSTAFQLHKQQMEGFISETAPALSYYLLLLQVYQLQQTKSYAEISAIAVSKAEYPLPEKIQLVAARLQAEGYLGKDASATAQELKKLATQFQKQVKKGVSGNPELLSTAWYALAYYYFLTHEPGLAQSYVDSVRDWDYRYGNFSGLGHALWLKGQICLAKGDRVEALSWLRRAEGIFAATQDKQSEAGIHSTIADLKGDLP